jgi:hypothetical protein
VLEARSGRTPQPGVLHAGKTGYLYVHDAKGCSVIRVSEVLVALKNERVLPTAEGVVIPPGSEC